MKLYNKKGYTLSGVMSDPFKLEKDIQVLVERNTSVLFGLEFVKSEMKIDSFRLDTLCFDKESKAFVIIEYKKGRNFSVIDQGYTYLSLLLNNKAEFILEYNENMNGNLRREDVDWSQSRIIFVSPRFTDYQKHSVNFDNIPFELWEITRFKNNTIGFNKLETTSEVDINSTITDESNVVKKVSKEVVTYNEAYHLEKSARRPDWIKELYFTLKERILGLGDDVECKFQKQYIAFYRNRPFTDLIIHNKRIVVMINLKKGQLRDPLNKTEDVSEKGHWGNGEYRTEVSSLDDLEYVMSLVKQSYLHHG